MADVCRGRGRADGCRTGRGAGGNSPTTRYFDKGSLATFGRAAAADFGRLRFGGLAAWPLWLFVHLMYLVGSQNRLLVLVQWAFHYFTFHRGARLITGPAGPLPEVREPAGQELAASQSR